ncbi:hypothetical protein GGI08_004565, partial [Coemansia sp. S2]
MTVTSGKRSKSDSTSMGAQQKSIDTFFKPKKQRVNEDGNPDGAQDMQWREFGQTWLGKFGIPTPSTKFAAFDLDGTLIRTTGPSVHARDSNDW